MSRIRTLVTAAALFAALGASAGARRGHRARLAGRAGGNGAPRRRRHLQRHRRRRRQGQADLLQPRRLLRQARRRPRRRDDRFRHQPPRHLRRRPLRAVHGRGRAAGFGDGHLRREGARHHAVRRPAVRRADRPVAALHVLPPGPHRPAALGRCLEGEVHRDRQGEDGQGPRAEGPRPVDLGRLRGDRLLLHQVDQS